MPQPTPARLRRDYPIGYSTFRTDLPGGRHANTATTRAWVARTDGEPPQELLPELVTSPHHWTQFAGWSPDGRQAVVCSGWEDPLNAAWEEEHRAFRFGTGGRLHDLWLVDLTNGAATNLTAVERVSAYNAGLFWWPGDPEHLGFGAIVGEQMHPFRMRRDGTGKQDLAHGEGFIYGAAVSPDGRRLAYHRALDNYQVFLAEADGSNPRRVETGNPWNFIPQWSPDGRWLLLLSGEHYDMHPYLVRADGTGLRKLADRGGYRGVVTIMDVPDYHGGSSDVPVWSPDGQWVYYTAQVGEAVELHRVTVAGEVERLSHSAPDVLNYHPALSRDGCGLAFGSTRSGSRRLYLAEADGSDPRPLTPERPGEGAMWAHWRP